VFAYPPRAMSAAMLVAGLAAIELPAALKGFELPAVTGSLAPLFPKTRGRALDKSTYCDENNVAIPEIAAAFGQGVGDCFCSETTYFEGDIEDEAAATLAICQCEEEVTESVAAGTYQGLDMTTLAGMTAYCPALLACPGVDLENLDDAGAEEYKVICSIPSCETYFASFPGGEEIVLICPIAVSCPAEVIGDDGPVCPAGLTFDAGCTAAISGYSASSYCDSSCKADIDACIAASTSSSDKPCFGFETHAVGAAGESIPMASLRAGDLVADGYGSTTRVIVNQHRAATVQSSLLEISTETATLEATPDHVIYVNGKFAAARNAVVGSKLGEHEEHVVTGVTSGAGAVINPLTASGKILTAGGILASTYPEWIADYMLSCFFVPLPISLSNMLSYLFPEAAQNYYDAVIEHVFNRFHPVHLKAALPPSLVPAAFLLGDLAVATGFVAYHMFSATFGAIAIVAGIAALVKAGKK